MRAAAALALGAALAACSPAPEAEREQPKPAETRREVILFLGDSLTAGYGVALEDAFPALLEERWRRDGSAARARNAGVSGSTTAGVLESLDWTLAPDVRALFLCVGANDGLRGLSLESSRRNISEIVAKAKARGLEVVVAGMKLPPNYGADYTKRFEALYPSIAREHGVKLMPFLLEGVAGRPELNAKDGIHPNEAGHRRIAETVHAYLAREGLLK